METYFRVNKPNLRLTEHIDTQSAVTRKQEPKKENRPRQKDRPHMFGEDITDVSLDALITLLLDLEKKASGETSEETDTNQYGNSAAARPEMKEFQERTHQFGPADPGKVSKAVYAYTHTAEYSKREGQTGSHLSHPESYSGDTEAGGPEQKPEYKPEHQDAIDIKHVRQLLSKAYKLKEKEVEHVSFVEGHSFLESLENAIDKALGTPTSG